MKLQTSAFDIAQRFVGLEEVEGKASNPQVLGMLRLDQAWPASDDVPWCSAFVNHVAWLLRLPRSKSLAARSWLTVGRPITLEEATPENDVVILKRGGGTQPGPEVLAAPGHVAFFAGLEGPRPEMGGAPQHVLLLGGNQHDAVCIERYPSANVLGVRRLA